MNRFQSAVWYATMAVNSGMAAFNTYLMVKLTGITEKVPGLLEELIKAAGG